MATTGRVLGLDQSLTNTGYAVLTYTGKVITTGVITTNARSLYHDRLIKIEEEILKLVKEHNIKRVYLEEVYARKNNSVALKLHDVKTIIELSLHKINIPFVVMKATLKSPDSWRFNLGIKSIDKEEWCVKLGEANEHIADAIGIGKGGLVYSATEKCNNNSSNNTKKPKKGYARKTTRKRSRSKDS